MRSLVWAPIPHASCPEEKREIGTETPPQKMEAEIGPRHPQAGNAKGCWSHQQLGARQGGKRSSFRTSRKSRPCFENQGPLDSGSLASTTGRE